ncbi:hypothetical protein LZ30DRAFT_377739 [Colletotrichum cereale]|nr:hypothetical protein LZ30DRAFT_377739 [Colletotrichum cereale]
MAPRFLFLFCFLSSLPRLGASCCWLGRNAGRPSDPAMRRWFDGNDSVRQPFPKPGADYLGFSQRSSAPHQKKRGRCLCATRRRQPASLRQGYDKEAKLCQRPARLVRPSLHLLTLHYVSSRPLRRAPPSTNRQLPPVAGRRPYLAYHALMPFPIPALFAHVLYTGYST